MLCSAATEGSAQFEHLLHSFFITVVFTVSLLVILTRTVSALGMVSPHPGPHWFYTWRRAATWGDSWADVSSPVLWGFLALKEQILCRWSSVGTGCKAFFWWKAVKGRFEKPYMMTLSGAKANVMAKISFAYFPFDICFIWGNTSS